ncbi:MAG: hypothetical protein ACU85V_08325 [Gammaproteobacteria bacterium]
MPSRSPTKRGASVLALLLAAPAIAGERAAEREAAADCAREALIEHDINVGTGVNNEQVSAASPLRLTLRSGSDAGRYAACLRREGFDPGERVAASFEHASACVAASRRHARITRETAGYNIRGGVDERALRDCLAPEIDVEVLLPAR